MPEAEEVASPVQRTLAAEGTISMNQLIEGDHQAMNTFCGSPGLPHSQSGCIGSHTCHWTTAPITTSLHMFTSCTKSHDNEHPNHIYAQWAPPHWYSMPCLVSVVCAWCIVLILWVSSLIKHLHSSATNPWHQQQNTSVFLKNKCKGKWVLSISLHKKQLQKYLSKDFTLHILY